jgi:hypothetical protein
MLHAHNLRWSPDHSFTEQEPEHELTVIPGSAHGNAQPEFPALVHGAMTQAHLEGFLGHKQVAGRLGGS